MTSGMRIMAGVLAVLVGIAGGAMAVDALDGPKTTLAAPSGASGVVDAVPADAADAAPDEDASCPECDEDGAPTNNDETYSSVDVGAIGEHGGALLDTDASSGTKEDGTIFSWISVCFSAFFEMINGLIGQVVWIDGSFEAYVGEDGVDVDGFVSVNGETVDLEETPVGDLDDATWGAADELDALDGAREQLPAVSMSDVEGVDVDECVDLEAIAAVACE